MAKNNYTRFIDSKYTKEICLAESLKYKTRNEFKKGSEYIWRIARKNKWMDEICSHMPIIHQWTFEECKEIALKYKYKIDLLKKRNDIYQKAQRKGWLDAICAHMEVTGNLFLRMVYAYEFSDKTVYTGLTYNKGKRNDQHLELASKINSPVYKHKINSEINPVYKIISDYVKAQDARAIEVENVDKYKKDGWRILNKNRGGVLGGNTVIYTKEKVKEDAQKYQILKEFQSKSPRFYRKAYSSGWLSEVCSHMDVQKLSDGFWTNNKEWRREEALKYQTRIAFSKECHGAYYAALKKGWLNDICLHMIKRKICRKTLNSPIL